MRNVLVVLLVGVLACAGVRGQGDEAGGWHEAVTESEVDVELAFTIPGLVAEVLVRAGERVEPGQVLARLDTGEIDASLALARLRAQSTLAIEEAEALLGLASNELARVEEAYAKGGVTEFEVERAKLEQTRRAVALDLARQRQGEYELQLRQLEATRTRYEVRSPVSGHVEEVGVRRGETVEELAPIARVVSVETLRLDVAVPLEATMGLEVGGAAEVRLSGVAPEGRAMEGRIVHVARVADAASGTRLVRVEVPNGAGVPGGARARVRFPGSR